MSEYPKYQRIILDVEIEVKDPVSAKAYTFDTTADGGIGLEGESPEEHLQRVVSQILHEGFRSHGELAGVKSLNSMGRARPRSAEGYYERLEIVETFGRNDDGTAIVPPGWDPVD